MYIVKALYGVMNVNKYAHIYIQMAANMVAVCPVIKLL